jgi:NodT family efflux transporter outer membrane factor (OMF) lipoprotein
VFNDPLLTALIEKALCANLDLKIAEARVRQARAARAIASAGLWPNADASGSYRRIHTEQSSSGSSADTSGDGGMNSSVSNSRSFYQDLYQAGLDAAWEIDIFGGVRRGVEAADADMRSAVEDHRDVLISLIAEVGTTYTSLRGYQQQIAIARKNLQAQQHTANITRKRYEAGMANGLDTANAEALAAATRAQIPVLEAAARQSIYSLSVLLAREPAALEQELSEAAPLPAAPPEIPVGLPSDLLRRRPDIRRAEAQLQAATARIGVATADLFPKFSLTGSIARTGDELHRLGTGDNHAWSWGPTISWPVFDAGRIRANIKVQNALQEQALASYEQTVLIALKDVESALVAFGKEQEHYAALTQAVTSGRKAVDIAMLQYTVGRSGFLDVLIAQRALYAYEDAWVQSSRSLATNVIALYKALGGGWEAGIIEWPAAGSTPLPEVLLPN